MSVSVSLAVALLALLVALFTLVALVAVYARVRALEAARAAGLSGYAGLVGRPAPAAVRPAPGQRGSLVAVLDAGCGLCPAVLAALAESGPGVRVVALVDRADAFEVPGRIELVADASARADLYEGYAPTLLAVDGSGAVRDRYFVYPDTDVAALVRGMAGGEIASAEVRGA